MTRFILGYDADGNQQGRDATPEEEAAALAVVAKARQAVQTNIDALALPDPTTANNTYLAIQSPTNANVVAQVRALTNQSNAVVAQLRALTRQNTAVIRLLLGLLDGTDGT